ncbi:hypothetical protein BDV93DRAFT_505573 [Ceratobasidium sp. AG-I]|nr:hypothetical protein BDV93DRAFT_505573 [Ceratobasidium sp. AG-I]
MFTKLKKAKQKAHHYADKVFRPSSEGEAGQSSSVSVNNSGTRNTPVPTEALSETASNAGTLTSPQAAPIVDSQPVIVSGLQWQLRPLIQETLAQGSLSEPS